MNIEDDEMWLDDFQSMKEGQIKNYKLLKEYSVSNKYMNIIVTKKQDDKYDIIVDDHANHIKNYDDKTAEEFFSIFNALRKTGDDE